MSCRRVLILFTTSALLWAAQAGRAQEPPEGETGVEAATVITKAVADLTDPAMPQIVILGENLGTTPKVFLGEDLGTLVPLIVQSATDALIVVDLPVATAPGSYMLIVQAASGPTSTSTIEVAIGTMDPQGPEGRLPVAQEPGGTQARQTSPSPAAETVQASGADLLTAKTIYIEQMGEDLHRYIATRLTDEGSPYKVLHDKGQADLWMMGTAAAPGQWEAWVRSGLGSISRPRVVCSVYIVPRGSEEVVLWATEASDLSGMTDTGRGPRQQVARVIVNRLQKAIKKIKKKQKK